MIKNQLKLALAFSSGVLLLPLVACPGGGGDGDGDGGTGDGTCDVDTDCGEGELCHPYLHECVADCSADDTVCADTTPVCNADDSPVQNMCGCDDTSCGDGEVCHPMAKVCVEACDPSATDECPTVDGDDWACYLEGENGEYLCQPMCDADDDCPNDAPICNLESGQCLATCDAEDPFRLTCGTGETCDVLTGLCVTAEEVCMGDEDCGENQACDLNSGDCFDLCTDIGAAGDPCGETEICAAVGECEEPCDNDACIAGSEELCMDDILATNFNDCADPDLVTGWCDNAQLAAHSRAAGGPIIESIEFVETLTAGGCDPIGRYAARIYSETAFDSSLYSQRVGQFEDDGTPSLTYSAGVGTPSHPSVMSIAGSPNYYELEFSICEDPAVLTFDIFALHVSNNNGEESNAFCFESGI